mmetsp:Transcript_48817/g.129021  ORF Transcript_48817/g.129021 Transcript_48817/m.129021 type:complete len:169 (-) Transcript_48817:1006-1512(-)
MAAMELRRVAFRARGMVCRTREDLQWRDPRSRGSGRRNTNQDGKTAQPMKDDKDTKNSKDWELRQEKEKKHKEKKKEKRKRMRRTRSRRPRGSSPSSAISSTTLGTPLHAGYLRLEARGRSEHVRISKVDFKEVHRFAMKQYMETCEIELTLPPGQLSSSSGLLRRTT